MAWPARERTVDDRGRHGVCPPGWAIRWRRVGSTGKLERRPDKRQRLPSLHMAAPAGGLGVADLTRHGHTPHRRPPRLAWWLGPVVLVPALAGAYRIRSAAVIECRIGINAGATLLGSLLLAIGALIAVPVVMEAVRRVLPRGHAAVVILLLAAAAWMVLLASSAPPPGYPEEVISCPGNRPAWWPIWLPG